MSSLDWVCIAASVALMIAAVMMKYDVELLTGGLKRKYTERSVKRFCSQSCLWVICFAVGVILEVFSHEGILYFIGWGLTLIGALKSLRLARSLVKK